MKVSIKILLEVALLIILGGVFAVLVFGYIRGKNQTTSANFSSNDNNFTVFSALEDQNTSLNNEAQKQFVKRIESVLETEKGNYCIYYKNLQTNEVVYTGNKKKYAPASTFKLFTAILILKDIENSKLKFDTKLKKEADETTEATFIKVDKLLEMMIMYSNNYSQTMFFDYLGRDKVDQRIQDEIGVKNTSLDKFETTAEDLGQLLEKLYKRELLSSKMTEYLIDLMISSSTKDRIKAGVPDKIPVANKIGNLDNEIHDAGIVYSPNGDYVLVILSDEVSSNKAVKVEEKISRIVWEYFGGVVISD